MERLRSEAIRAGRSFALDIRIRTGRGTRRWLRLTCDVEMENGRPARIFGAKQDITESRQAQEEIQALQSELLHLSQRRAVGTTMATLAHDLNQPLAAITNHAAGARRLLRRGASDDARIEEGLDAITQNAMRAGLLIRRMRDLTEGSRLERRPTRLVTLVREATARAIAEGGEEIFVEDRLQEDAIVLVDPLQFRQVVISLVRNACEALVDMPRREIIVATGVRAGRIELTVEDSGPGFAPGMRERLFDAVATTRPGQLGMGLALSRTIVEAHGGEIWAEDGKEGARLCLALPVHSRVTA
jgi:two-component system sensor kinase FixL